MAKELQYSRIILETDCLSAVDEIQKETDSFSELSDAITKSRCVNGGHKLWRNVLSPNVSYHAIRFGLELAKELQYSRIILETDCLSAVGEIQKETDSFSELSDAITKSRCVNGGHKLWRNVLSPNVSYHAIRFGLELAKELQYSRIILETDCLSAVGEIQKETDSFSELSDAITKSRCVNGGHKLWRNVLSPNVSYHAIRFGLELAKELQYSRIILETDCLSAVGEIQKETDSFSELSDAITKSRCVNGGHKLWRNVLSPNVSYHVCNLDVLV
ncbi:hypothetical protein PTKIN_Ptkin11bG0101800 [Pterospermum kingtungense]